MDFMHILGQKEATWNTIFSIFERRQRMFMTSRLLELESVDSSVNYGPIVIRATRGTNRQVIARIVHATNSPPTLYSNSHNANTSQGYNDASNGIKTVLAFHSH